MRPNAPKLFLDGSQVSVKMLRPSSWNHGHASRVVETAIKPRITRTISAASRAMIRKARSAMIPGGRVPFVKLLGRAGASVDIASFQEGDEGRASTARPSFRRMLRGGRARARGARRGTDLLDLGLGLVEQALGQGCVVDLGGQFLAVPVDVVQEVLDRLALRRVALVL